MERWEGVLNKVSLIRLSLTPTEGLLIGVFLDGAIEQYEAASVEERQDPDSKNVRHLQEAETILANGKGVEMMEREIVVPEGMLKAIVDASPQRNRECIEFAYEHYRPMLRAALGWLGENPIVPGVEQRDKLVADYHKDQSLWERTHYTAWVVGEWQRRMFLAPLPAPIDPLVMYIMRHFDDVENDPQARRNRAEAAVFDYRKYLERSK